VTWLKHIRLANHTHSTTNNSIDPVISEESALRGRHIPPSAAPSLAAATRCRVLAQPCERRYLYIDACHHPCSKTTLGPLNIS
jgi:hypothetical protein